MPMRPSRQYSAETAGSTVRAALREHTPATPASSPWQDLGQLLEDRLPDHPAPAGVSVEGRRGKCARLLERDVWRERRDLRVAHDLEHSRPLTREGAFPALAHLARVFGAD